MSKKMNYRWLLRERMAEHGLWKTTELAPLLAERGIHLSAAQIYRLVAHTPERWSLDVLAALCDIFGCGPGDLIDPHVVAPARRAVGDEAHGDLIAVRNTVRPLRARIIDQP